MNIALLGYDCIAANAVYEGLINAGHAVERCTEPLGDGGPLGAFIAVIDDAPAGAFLEGGEEVFLGALERAFYTTMRSCRSALVRLEDGGALIFVFTARARLGECGYTAASAAAGGLHMQTRSYAVTTAPVGIRSNGIKLYDGWDARGLNNAVAYLLSPASAYMTGNYITLGAPRVVCAQPAWPR